MALHIDSGGFGRFGGRVWQGGERSSGNPRKHREAFKQAPGLEPFREDCEVKQTSVNGDHARAEVKFRLQEAIHE